MEKSYVAFNQSRRRVYLSSSPTTALATASIAFLSLVFVPGCTMDMDITNSYSRRVTMSLKEAVTEIQTKSADYTHDVRDQPPDADPVGQNADEQGITFNWTRQVNPDAVRYRTMVIAGGNTYNVKDLTGLIPIGTLVTGVDLSSGQVVTGRVVSCDRVNTGLARYVDSSSRLQFADVTRIELSKYDGTLYGLHGGWVGTEVGLYGKDDTRLCTFSMRWDEDIDRFLSALLLLCKNVK